MNREPYVRDIINTKNHVMAGTVTHSGAVTFNSTVTASLGSGITASGEVVSGTGNGSSGAFGTTTETVPIVHKTSIAFSGASITITDTGANGAHGSQLLYTFPVGYIKILSCFADFTGSSGQVGLTATATYDIGIGSAAAGVDNAVLAGTEQDILVKQEGNLVADVATVQAGSITDVGIDGTTTNGTAAKAYLNVAFEADDASDDDSLDCTGTIVLYWVNLGDW